MSHHVDADGLFTISHWAVACLNQSLDVEVSADLVASSVLSSSGSPTNLLLSACNHTLINSGLLRGLHVWSKNLGTTLQGRDQQATGTGKPPKRVER